jgi:hypothetical protein
VLAVEDCTVVLEVTEDHPDMDALASIIRGTELVQDTVGCAKIAAELVLEHRLDASVMIAFARRTRDETGEWPTQAAFVRAVELRSCKVISTSSSERPRYHAVLAVTLTRPDFAAVFAVDAEYGAVATPTCIDVNLRDFWDHV